MIQFIEHPVPGYPARTWENAMSVDLTIALAIDFNTGGEKCTQKMAGEKYLGLNLIYLTSEEMKGDLFAIETSLLYLQNHNAKSINFAGNGIYTLFNSKYKFTQKDVDEMLFNYLSILVTKYQIDEIRSGGQTGVDEAAIKASDKLGVKTICCAPLNWMFRDKNGKDICDETLFKERFT